MSSSQPSDHKSPAEPSQLLLCACGELGPFAEIVALNCTVGMGDSVNMSEEGTVGGTRQSPRYSTLRIPGGFLL